MKRKVRIVSILACIAFILGGIIPSRIFAVETEKASHDIEQIIAGIIEWKKSDVGASGDEFLINDTFLQYAGTTPGDWYPIALGRYGYPDNNTGYLSVIADKINQRYQTREKLHSAKATEWHRISLAITAMGGDPTQIGSFEGQPINLIADGTYNRALTASPGRQGINGWIWALISLDSKRYAVPENACHQRQDFIIEILKAQHEDGGWALSGGASDPDITAMAIQALSPYYNSEIVYSYTSSRITQKDEELKPLRDENGKIVYQNMEKSVSKAVDEGLAWLSSVQCDDGDFFSWGTQNLESTCQVIVALTSLGIDPQTDSRFITASGKTLMDGVMKYRLPNGGFVHSFTYDPDNPTSLPDKANTMASEQCLYTLVSVWRQQNNMRTLYDMREDFSAEQRAAIDKAISAISQLDENSSLDAVSAALGQYIAVEETDRCYVTNYRTLSGLAKKYSLQLPQETVIFSGRDPEETGYITFFTSGDREEVFALPASEQLTTQHYVKVVTLFEKLKNADNAEENRDCYILLEKAYNQIELVQSEIDAVKAEIKEKLYPFDSIGLSDRKTVHKLYDRYMALSEYDRSTFETSDTEGLIKSKTQVDNLYMAVWIAAVSLAVAAAITAAVVWHIKKRKRDKAKNLMPESNE